MNKINICKWLEIIRWLSVSIGIYFALQYGKDPVSQFEILALFSVIGIAGLTGIESLFLGKYAGKITGYEGAGGGYQRQSGINNLSLAIAIILSAWFGWGFYAIAAITLVMLIFLFFSSINHLYSYIREDNKNTRNLLRPILTFLLIGLILPFLIMALNYINK